MFVGGTGGVMEDSSGSFIVASCCYFDHIVDAQKWRCMLLEKDSC